ncbi:TIR domain-containing protein [Streptomyces olivoreticuli]
MAFDSADIKYYYLMEAWRDNEHIDFNFFDAHDINTARDDSLDDTIKRRLSERLSNAKQAVVLVSETTKVKADKPSFLAHEMKVIARLGLPVVFANLNGKRKVQQKRLPTALLEQYTISVSFQPAIIKYALDDYVESFQKNLSAVNPKSGPYQYKDHVYTDLGL